MEILLVGGSHIETFDPRGSRPHIYDGVLLYAGGDGAECVAMTPSEARDIAHSIMRLADEAEADE